MSIECEICDTTIFVPDTIWYAGTILGHRCVTLCGCCASCIPIEERDMFLDDDPFTITFGIVNADLNTTKNWYSAAGAVSGPVRFTVSTDAIEKYLPNSNFLLKELSPYYRIEWFVTKTVEDYLREKESDPNTREKAVALILPYYKTLHPWCILKKALAAGHIGTMGIPILEPDKERAENLLDDMIKLVKEVLKPESSALAGNYGSKIQ